MTIHKDLKQRIRDRSRKTGESYTAARLHIMRERALKTGLPVDEPVQDAPSDSEPQHADAAILKVNPTSVRARVLGDESQITFRSRDAWRVVPGQIATLVFERRWTWRGDPYASGRIHNPRIDAARLGLDPLELNGGELVDVASHTDPWHRSDPYAPIWARNTGQPRPAFEFDPIAWGAFPDADDEENPTFDAVELAEMGDIEGARILLMETSCKDLRCLDAHAHLGNLEFDSDPKRAMLHYEVGIRIGELSLPAGYDGLLIWGRIYNRPFLRCLHGYGLCLWRLGQPTEAAAAFERILRFNPMDNQGARFSLQDIREGRSWEEMHGEEDRAEQELLRRARETR